MKSRVIVTAIIENNPVNNLKIQQQQAANASASNVTNNIKAYGVPLAIAGLMVIGGISTYFYFKKKKA